MEIMHTMASEAIAQRPKRRYYSPELKSQVVAECHNTGASVAGVALAHGINANIVHRWLREQAMQLASAPQSGFIVLDLGSPVLEHPVAEAASAVAARDICIEVRRSAGIVTVNWPIEGAASCAAWLREWLR